MCLNFCLQVPLWLLPQLYAAGLLIFHSWHWAAHQRWLLYPMWKVHMYHHWVVYPPKRFMSIEYKNDKKGRTTLGSILHDGPLYLGMMTNILILWHFKLLRPTDIIVSIFTYASVGSYSNWLHHTFHIEGHWIERFVYFHDLRALHYTHHQGTAKQNYGFLDFCGDVATGSAQSGDYSLSNWKGSAPLGDGSEHRSKVRPGNLPGILQDGLHECFCCVICFAIEFLIGIQGIIFGAAKNKKALMNDTKLAQSGEYGQASDSIASVWTDLFLFS